jgi:hypothetical protein
MKFDNNSMVLRLAGPVILMRGDGYDITPPQAKIRALLTLIATGPQMSRPRTFVQDKLWSASSSRKGAASLRQALSSLRNHLGPDADVLRTDGTSISLDPTRAKIDLRITRYNEEYVGGAPEFAEGLDVDDPEFEDWLRERRQEFARLAKKTAPREPDNNRATLVTLIPSCQTQNLRTSAEILTADIAAQVARFGNAVVQLDPNANGPQDRLAIQVRSAALGDKVRYQVSLMEIASKSVIWTGDCDSAPNDPLTNPDLFSELTANAAFEAVRHFGRVGPHADLNIAPNPDRLAYQMYAHFPFRVTSDMADIDTWLAADHGPESQALQLAWRARLRVVSCLERAADHAKASQQAQDFARQAMTLDPGNATIVALSSEVALQVLSQPEVAAEMAQTSVRLDPNNPYALGIFAQTLTRCGRASEGLLVAQKALRLSVGHPNRSWWHTICTLAAIQSGEMPLARKHAEIAHFQAPDFRPPLRFLAALRFNAGDETGTAQALQGLKAIEPDFSLARMADHSYPVASLRQTPLMAVTQSGLL